MVSENPINMASVAAALARQASPIEDDFVERLRQGVIIMGFGPGQAEMVDTVTANQAMRKAADRIEAQSHTIRVMREAAEIGLEYVIEAANQRKEKDAVFDNAMRDIERIESALGVSGHD